VNVHIEGGKPDEPPVWRIERFVTRTDKSTRSAREGRVWGKNQAIDRKQALLMTTYNAAKFIGEEKMLGSIENGKYADLVVFNGDYLSVPDDKIDELLVDMTILGGKMVYQRAANK
jgi:predicted amidohydrolase YtcJ